MRKGTPNLFLHFLLLTSKMENEFWRTAFGDEAPKQPKTKNEKTRKAGTQTGPEWNARKRKNKVQHKKWLAQEMSQHSTA